MIYSNNHSNRMDGSSRTPYDSYGNFGGPPPPYSLERENGPSFGAYGSVNNIRPLNGVPRFGVTQSDYILTPSSSAHMLCKKERSSVCYLCITLLLCLVSLLLVLAGVTLFYSPASTRERDYRNGRNFCLGHSTRIWTGMPANISFHQNIDITIEGYATSGLVIVKPTDERVGSIFTEVNHTPYSPFASRIKYDLQQIQHMDEYLTKLIIKMPNSLEDETCIDIFMEIQLPYSATTMHIKSKNTDIEVRPLMKDIDHVRIDNMNGYVEVDRWSGKELIVINNNGKIKTGKLHAKHNIALMTKNAPIYLMEKVEASSLMYIKTFNGLIDASAMICDGHITLSTTNSPIRVGSLDVFSVAMHTSNDKISVDRSDIKDEIVAMTSNGPIDMNILTDIAIQIHLKTSNNNVNLKMNDAYEGHFMMKTDGHISMDSDRISYDRNWDHEKTGYRNGREAKGDLKVENSHGDISIVFIP